MVFQQPVTPVVQLPDAPTPEVGVADVLIGSFGIVGAMCVLALISGLLMGGVFIAYRRWQDKHQPDLPTDDHTRLGLSA